LVDTKHADVFLFLYVSKKMTLGRYECKTEMSSLHQRCRLLAKES